MTMITDAEPALYREFWPPHGANLSAPAADAALEFGRFRVLLRRRRLVANGVPVELGTRAFDVLLVLLEADGSLVTKDELLRRVWPSIVVTEENLKVQISALRKALGEDRDFIRTEFGRGYRFVGSVHSIDPWRACQSRTRWAARSRQRPAPQWISRGPDTVDVSQGHDDRGFDPARTERSESCRERTSPAVRKRGTTCRYAESRLF